MTYNVLVKPFNTLVPTESDWSERSQTKWRHNNCQAQPAVCDPNLLWTCYAALISQISLTRQKRLKMVTTNRRLPSLFLFNNNTLLIKKMPERKQENKTVNFYGAQKLFKTWQDGNLSLSHCISRQNKERTVTTLWSKKRSHLEAAREFPQRKTALFMHKPAHISVGCRYSSLKRLIKVPKHSAAVWMLSLVAMLANIPLKPSLWYLPLIASAEHLNQTETRHCSSEIVGIQLNWWIELLTFWSAINFSNWGLKIPTSLRRMSGPSTAELCQTSRDCSHSPLWFGRRKSAASSKNKSHPVDQNTPKLCIWLYKWDQAAH